MCEKIGWLIEVINVIACLHFFYKQKIHSYAAAVLLAAADLFFMEMVSRFSLDKVTVSVIYVLYWIYILTEFGSNLKHAVLTMALLVICISIFQLLAYIPWAFCGKIQMSDFVVVVVQAEVFALLFVLRNLLGRCFSLFLEKNYLLWAILLAFAGYFIYEVIQYKENHEMVIEYFLLYVMFGVAVCLCACLWQRERRQHRQKEMQLRITELCDDSFREMIETIRLKQHDFYNHIQTLRNLHYLTDNYEDLVQEQKRYCDDILYDNRFYRLLNEKSPILSGFLYGKLMEADKLGIRAGYKVHLTRTMKKVPEYIIVEMIGILFDNALEYITSEGYRELLVEVWEDDGGMEFCVENPVRDISYEDVRLFFKKEKSTKAGHSGIGLYKIKEYAQAYHLKLHAEKTDREGQNYLKISVCV